VRKRIARLWAERRERKRADLQTMTGPFAETKESLGAIT
jgi:hypothetical protein